MSLNNPLDIAFEGIETISDLASFIALLRADFEQNRHEWESWTLEDYFESMEAWLIANSKNLEEPESKWKTYARILYSTKIYE